MAGRALHGVNLTGWLALESWVTPELFAGSGALDEAALVTALGRRRYAEVVRKHRQTFITEDDFARIAARGFNAVRLPIPWYVYEPAVTETMPYVGCITYVDRALEWAEEYGLSMVMLVDVDPGANQPSVEDAGPSDLRDLREHALNTVRRLSERYASRMGFFGIELADDPKVSVRRGLSMTDGIPLHMLRNYYREAYAAVRDAAGDDVVVIMPDGGLPSGWRKFMAGEKYVNVWYDCHLDRTSTRLDATGPTGIRRLVASERERIRDASRSGMPVMVGRWSASLPIADSSMTPEGRIASERIFTSEQLAAFEGLPAWFFETWKTSGLLTGWDARLALATFEREMLA